MSVKRDIDVSRDYDKDQQGITGQSTNLKHTTSLQILPNPFTTKGLPGTPQYHTGINLSTSRARNSSQADLPTLRSGVPRGPLIESDSLSGNGKVPVWHGKVKRVISSALFTPSLKFIPTRKPQLES